jgi:hypothetical protein
VSATGNPQVHLAVPVPVTATGRDYRGCIQMHPDKYPWMVDKFVWIWMISMDIHIIHKTDK